MGISSHEAELQFEKEMIRGEVKALESLLDELKRDTRTLPQLESFTDVTRQLYESIRDTIDVRLELISAGEVPFEERSKRHRALRSLIHALNGFLYNTYISMKPIPRQMYYLADHLLDCYRVKCNYVIGIRDEIQVVSLSHFLKSYRCDMNYVEFWHRSRNIRFYFVQVVRKISTPDRYLDWIMVLHEISHIIDAERNIVQQYLPELSLFDAMTIIDGGVESYGPTLYEKAQKRLHAAEFAADLVVTETYGVGFGWRLLKEYGHWVDVFEPATTHPPINTRISLIIDELKTFLNIEPVSRLLKQQFEERGWQEDLTCLSQIGELQRIRATIRTQDACKLTNERIRLELVGKHYPGSTSSQNLVDDEKILRVIQRDFLQGKPTVLSPPLLYHIYIYDLWDAEKTKERAKVIQEMCNKLKMKTSNEFEARLNELLSDCVRLYCVSKEWESSQSQTSSSGLSPPSVSVSLSS
jgi:hypothetical protein